MFGHRADGKRLRHMDPIIRITPYLMPMRCDAQVFLEHKLDYELLSRYIAQKGREGERLTFMQLIAAAYVRGVSQHPEVNRFIFNKQYFARNNCSISYVVLADPQNPDSNENTVRIEFDPSDTVFDVRDRMDDAVQKSRAAKDSDFLIKLAKVVLGIPGMTTLVVNTYRLLDRYGLSLHALTRELPFYSGLFMTNNASIGLHHVWHHIYNFGDVSLFMGMGSVMKEAWVEPDGRTRMRRWLPIGITADERVCSGAHYAAFFGDVMHYLSHPEELEVPPETVKYDEKCEYHVPKIRKEKQEA